MCDIGRVEAALATQIQEVFGQELYSTLEQKAAALMRNIIADHPFIDGNKRTATLAALTLIELNGREFIAKPGELEDFAVRASVEQLDIDAVAAWLSSHSTQRT